MAKSRLTTDQKLAYVQRIINSCETYDQLLTCFSFSRVEGTHFNSDSLSKAKILRMIQRKAYEILERTE
jgi:hypothetical protein